MYVRNHEQGNEYLNRRKFIKTQIYAARFYYQKPFLFPLSKIFPLAFKIQGLEKKNINVL